MGACKCATLAEWQPAISLTSSAAAAQADPSKPALIDEKRTVSWAELDGLVDQAAGGLLAAGSTAGDRVGVLLPNSIEFAVAYFGVLRAGLVAVPLNTAYTAAGAELPGRRRRYARSSSPTPSSASSCDELSDVSTVEVGGDSWDELLARAAGLRRAGRQAPAARTSRVLLYTSGTTGRPRGAMLSHRALLANLDQLVRIDPPSSPRTTWCCWCCRCSTSTASTPGSAWSRRRLRPACSPSGSTRSRRSALVRDHQVSQHHRRAADVRGLVDAARPRVTPRDGAARRVRRRAACRRRCCRGAASRPATRSTRATG